MKKWKTMAALLLLVGGFVSSSPAVETKPNLLLIITDEHNFRTLGCYRDQLTPEQALMWGPDAVIETPHIDSMAKLGTLFTDPHTPNTVRAPYDTMFTDTQQR